MLEVDHVRDADVHLNGRGLVIAPTMHTVTTLGLALLSGGPVV
ncbi:hypothetical protein [Streptomyces sp. sk226]|nr:hypothetical protein [Streptomyces sp. sk226]